MTRLYRAVSALTFVFLACGSLSPAHADIVLQNESFLTDGVWYANPISPPPGVDWSAQDFASGLGTVVFTDTTVGSTFFDIFVDLEVSVPFYNEYGQAVGTPASGQSWEIGDPTYSTIMADAQAGALTNANYLPGGTDNYNQPCKSLACQLAGANGDVSNALGFTYGPVQAGYQEVVTIALSTTTPASGFYLTAVNPADPNNPTPTTVYISGTAVNQQIPVGPVPEPGSYLLLGTVAVLIGNRLRRKVSC